MLRIILALTVMLSIVAPPAVAQRSRATQAQLRNDIREILFDLRQAASAGNWEAMQDAFPSSGAIAERVHDVVTGGPAGGGLSFWSATAKPNFDELVLVPVKPDLVAFSLPFVDGTSPGSYGAVFEHREGLWQITCFQEAFPTTNLAPGCVPDAPSSR